MNMKLSDYLTFAIMLVPTVLIVAAAVISLTSPDPVPEYHPPLQVVSSAGLYPVDEWTP